MESHTERLLLSILFGLLTETEFSSSVSLQIISYSSLRIFWHILSKVAVYILFHRKDVRVYNNTGRETFELRPQSSFLRSAKLVCIAHVSVF